MVRDRWRYVLPCGHHNWATWHTNEPDRRLRCRACGEYYPEDAVIDKKEEGAPPL